MTVELKIRVPRSEFEVDLHISLDQTTTLVGASGSGKSTVLQSIAGVDASATGVIRVGRERWLMGSRALPSTLRSVGYLGQRDGLFPHLSAADNVAFPLRVDGLGRTQRIKRASDLLDRLGLSELVTKRPHELSGGQKRRVALARALSASRDLYLLDEPLAGLDERTAMLATDFIADQLSDFDSIGIVAMHDAGTSSPFSSRAVRLDRGRVIEDFSVPVAPPHARGSARVRQNIGGRQLDCREGSR